MNTRPQVLGHAAADGGLRLDLEIPADLVYFRGHFPDVPMTPGVVQVDWAIRLAAAHFPLPSRFRRLSALKFARVMPPRTRLFLDLAFDAARGELSFRYYDGRGEFSAGRVGFA